MEYMYAAMLLHSAGKEITESAVENVLSAAGIKPDAVRVKALVAALAEVDIDEALKAPVFAAAAAPAAAPAAEEKAEEKPEEEEKKEEEEEDLQGLSALFG
ncbi:50S ribosomal protein P1 [Candidatus Bathyarchaeota archaeon]|nr:MAG: 50S ribosomal protein P1 [Candidatus Bathyarchaeota archaeon]